MTDPRNAQMFDLVSRLSVGRTPSASPEDIFFCFRLLLGRLPNPEEVPGHMALAGNPLPEIVSVYLNSAEFAHRNLLETRQSNAVLFSRDEFSIYADPDELAIGRHIATGHDYEAHVSAAFRRLLKPGDAAVDIGANIGFFSLLASRLVGSTGRVIAIEPNRSNCRMIEASRIENGFDQLSVHSVAASQSNGMLALHAVSSNGAVTTISQNIAAIMRSEIVQGVRLDDLLQLDRLDFIKIDVEGFEFDALVGFSEHIKRFKPKIVSEFAPGMMPDPSGYIRLLRELGYHLSVVGSDGVGHDVGQDAEALIAFQRKVGGDHIDILAV